MNGKGRQQLLYDTVMVFTSMRACCRLAAFKQPYLTRNSERQLLMYLIDKRVRFSILLLTLHLVSQIAKGLQRGAEFYFRLPHRLPKRLLIHYSSLPNNHRKVNRYWGCNDLQ